MDYCERLTNNANDFDSIVTDMLKEIESLRAALAEAEKKAERYEFLKDSVIEYKPAGYDGCIVGRYDVMWVSDINNLDEEIDAAIANESKTRSE